MGLFGNPALGQTDPGMFRGIIAGSPVAKNEPLDPDKMLEQKMLAQRKVKVKDFKVHTFDLNVKLQVTEYKKAYKRMYKGSQDGTVSVQVFDKQFVPQTPGWVVHMEWVEYELEDSNLMKTKELK